MELSGAARSPSARRWRRRLVIGALVVAVLGGLTWGGLVWRFVANPTIDAHQQVDAVYVLGPVETRIEQTLAIMDEGVAPVLLATTSINPSGDAYATDHCGLQTPDYGIECLVPEPYSTRGEAQLLAREIEANGWERVAVVTSTPHAARARMLIERCTSAEILMWDYPQDLGPMEWFNASVYQSGAWAKAQWDREC